MEWNHYGIGIGSRQYKVWEWNHKQITAVRRKRMGSHWWWRMETWQYEVWEPTSSISTIFL